MKTYGDKFTCKRDFNDIISKLSHASRKKEMNVYLTMYKFEKKWCWYRTKLHQQETQLLKSCKCGNMSIRFLHVLSGSIALRGYYLWNFGLHVVYYCTTRVFIRRWDPDTSNQGTLGKYCLLCLILPTYSAVSTHLLQNLMIPIHYQSASQCLSSPYIVNLLIVMLCHVMRTKHLVTWSKITTIIIINITIFL